jgi:hypothetical protein
MAEALYPHATHIVDIYHAREHLHGLANHLAFIAPDPAQWLQNRSAELDVGDSQAIIAATRQYPLAGVEADERDTKIGYFEDNAHRMRCADMALPRHGPHRAARRHLIDSKTQIRRPNSRARSSPTRLSCTPFMRVSHGLPGRVYRLPRRAGRRAA